MPARPLSSTTISFGLVSIPIKVYTATSAQNVHFNQLHSKCGSRLKQRMWCPVDNEYVERADIVKGYEFGKNQYVQFEESELKNLEAERFQTMDLVEFVPESTVDFIYIEKSYYIGPDKGGNKAFNLLTKAMRRMERIAVGKYWTRGKVQLVLMRPYKKGLILHQVFYANEVRDYEDVDLGEDTRITEAEDKLADKLIDQLSSEAFDPKKYRDEYVDRVRAAADEKIAGREITAAPEQPAAQIIDLFEALKQSLANAESGRGKGSDGEPARATGTDDVARASDSAKPAKPIKGPRKAKKS